MRTSMKRFLSLILSLAMVVSLFPSMAADAAETTGVWEVASEASDTTTEDTSVNVAAYKNGGEAYADSVTVTGGDKGFLNDGTYTNAWVAADNSIPVTTGVKLDARYNVDKVRVVFKEGQVYNFTVSYYNTNTGGYTELYSGSSYSEDNAEVEAIGHKYYSEYVLDEPIVTNDVKVTLTSAGDTTVVPSIAEIEVFGTEYDASKAPRNLAYGATATASYVDWGRAASNAVDGSLGTFWDGASIGDGQWLMVDLGELCKISEIKATAYHDAGDGRYYLYYVEVSADGEEWIKVADREETYGTVASYANETYTFDEVEAQYVRITVTKNSANGIAHVKELEVWGYPSVIRENIALGKTVSSSNADYGRGADVIVDGDYSNYWDGGSYPQSFMIDLGAGYFVDTMKAYPYTDGSRHYEYTIESSLDGYSFTKHFERTADMGVAYAGETFELDEPVEMRFIKVTMTYNSSNPSVHMKEFEVFGELNPDYVAPTTDVNDPDNIAYGREVRTHLATDSVKNVTDGFNITTCTGEFAPAYFDIDLEENHDLSEIILNFPVSEGVYYYYTIYGSVDGSNYDRLYQKRDQNPATDEGDKIVLSELGLESTEYRIVRVYMEYAKGSSSALLSEVRIHGTATGENTGDLRTGSIDEVLNIKPFSETEYAAEFTAAETIENVYGIIDRNIGKEYRDWFTFAIAANTENDNDYFTVGPDAATGKILVTGNDGVSLASGLNYYLENYCNVQVSEQTSQVKMPETIVAMEEAVRCETPYKVRYAFNYCTLNYTFSYADAEVFQREYDWMALSGVNCVLDLAGQEAVWIKFLQNFGYSFDEAKDWIAGPSYYAWQFMDNMEVVGGPVSDEWVVGRLEMARENQRFKNSLGMQTVFQGYAGMIPCNFADFQPEVEILDQGTWCSLPRPDMIRTDGELYDQYAELFYAAQEWAFGPNSDYYAVDPFHEGGIRPDDLSDEVIAAEVLDSLLKYDEDAVWMVQAWWDNPTNGLLNGMGEYRQDHVLILDLTGVYDSKWDKTQYGNTTVDADEFNGTDWVCCLLDNYGGNPSMDGNLQRVIDEITRARDEGEHMKGIGLISEATYDNPALYQMLFDTTWVSEGTIDMEEWLDNYVIDRYGAESESAREAWEILETTIYGRGGHTSQVMASTSPSLVAYGLPYSSYKAEKALALLFEDFETLCGSESYMYDLSELMRQIVNNYAVVELGNMKTAYDAGDLETFKALKEKFLNAFDLLELVLGTQKDLMAGNWIGGAEDWAIDTGADDFAYDSMVINAKTIITVWAPSSYLGSYAYRNYQGMFDDIYKPLWKNFLDRQEDILETGATELEAIGYTNTCMEWIYADQDYAREADNSPENMSYVVSRVLDECSTYVESPENEGNIALEKPVTTTSERADSPGAPGGGYAAHITDGLADTYWDGVRWDINPEAVIDLEAEYAIDKINVLCYVAGTRYYLYDIYSSLDGENWTQIVNKTATDAGTDSGDDFTFENVTARYIKLVGTYNSSNEGFHVKEVRVYGEAVATTPEVDKSALQKLVDDCVGIDISGYTEESVATLVAALFEAEAVLADENATSEDVSDAIAALEAAVAALEEVAPEVVLDSISVATEPKTAYTEGEAFDPTGLVLNLVYSDNTTDTVTYSEENAADFGFTPNAALTTADTAVTITYGGKETTLAITVEAEAPGEFKYTAEEPFVFPSESGVTETLEAEYMEIHNTGENEAWPMVVADRDWASNGKIIDATNAGDSAVLYYDAPVAGVYTVALTYRSGDSKNAFSWTEADGKIAEGNVTAGASDEAGANHTVEFEIEVLTAGAGTLTILAGDYNAPQFDKFDIALKPVDKDALNEAIAAAEALNSEDYVDFTGVTAALNEAKEVAADDDATQEEVDAAAATLNGAIDALERVVPPVTKEALEKAIADAAAYDETLYTEESWAALEVAVAEAEAVMADEEATQAEVDAAAEAIGDAIEDLEEKPVISDEVIRISGTTRYETGYEVADEYKEKLGVDKFDAVVVATGKNFADALSGSYLAVVKNAPILLTNGNDDNVAMLHDYIKANVTAGGKVYILGGEAAVPASVAAIEGYDVVRLSGPTRYDTNLAILAEAGITGDELIVATGKNFADSLSASAVKMPILLVKPGAELTDGQKAIADAMNTIYIVGGEGAVDAAIAEELAAYAAVERVYGATRQETSVAIAEKFLPDAETVVVASAKNFPDGLCGGPLAAALDAPLLLTTDGKTDAAADYTAANAIASGYVLGGEGALADESVVDVFGLESADEIIMK